MDINKIDGKEHRHPMLPLNVGIFEEITQKVLFCLNNR
jgi:hypothetical protein